MISKRDLMNYIESLDDRICDLRYDHNLLLKKFTELEAALVANKKGEKPAKRKVGRPRKNSK